MSARGLSFSARKRAVMTPVESRTHTTSTSGTAASIDLLERAELVVLERRVDRELGLLRGGRRRREHRGKADGPQKCKTAFDHVVLLPLKTMKSQPRNASGR